MIQRLIVFSCRDASALDLPVLQPGERGLIVGIGTDINRRLSDLMMDCPCGVTHDEPSIAGGMYRVILLNRV